MPQYPFCVACFGKGLTHLNKLTESLLDFFSYYLCCFNKSTRVRMFNQLLFFKGICKTIDVVNFRYAHTLYIPCCFLSEDAIVRLWYLFLNLFVYRLPTQF